MSPTVPPPSRRL